VLGASPITLQLAGPGDLELGERLKTIARSQTETAIMKLGCVEADSPPGVVWETYANLPDGVRPSAESPHFVGALALFGDGVRSESNTFGAFSYPLNRAISASQNPLPLNVTFVPVSGVVSNGAPTRVDLRAQVRIYEMSISLETTPTQGAARPR
jgi:hypothetical protein